MNDKDSYEGKYAYSIIESAIDFDDEWYDWSKEQILDAIKKGSKNNFVHIKYNYWELGRDEEWFEEQKRNLNNDLMKIKRELLLEWTQANDRSPFTEEQLSTISNYIVKTPIKNMYIRNYKFKIYEELVNMFRKNWIVSIDIGGGLLQDSTVISIIDPMDKKLKAIFKSNNISAKELELLVEEMLSTFFPNAVIIPERNSLGIPILESMCANPKIRPRLYYEVNEKLAERIIEDPRVNQRIKKKKKVQVYGQYTSSANRNIMFNEILAYMVDQEPENIIVPELYEELKALERNNRNKIAARTGEHDDVIMSWLIGLYALLYGKNINKFVSLVGDYTNEAKNEVTNSRTTNMALNVKKLYMEKNLPSDLLRQITEYSRNTSYMEENNPENEKKTRIANSVKMLLKK